MLDIRVRVDGGTYGTSRDWPIAPRTTMGAPLATTFSLMNLYSVSVALASEISIV